MKLTRVENGYILELDGQIFVFEKLVDALAEPSGRYDDERIYFLVLPGDKNPAFTEEHAKRIWGGS